MEKIRLVPNVDMFATMKNPKKSPISDAKNADLK